MLQMRADQAAAALTAARARFASADHIDVALRGAALFGVQGAVPSVDVAVWADQARRARAELDARLAQLAAAASGFSRVSASATAQRDHDVARLRVIFGPNFPVVARFTPSVAASLAPLFASSPSLLRNRPLEAVTWLARAARVRPGAARVDEAMLYAEALSSGMRLELSVAQLPIISNDVWAGLPLSSGASPKNCVSLVALGAPAAARAALVIDEWLETTPNTVETTGVAFHIEDAAATAPQTMLIGVQPDGFPEWTLESVEGTLLEALEVTHLRAVDPDALAGVGQFLPALLFATNPGEGTPDAISTDFTLATLTAPLQPARPDIPIIRAPDGLR